jgi:hypothetical protein
MSKARCTTKQQPLEQHRVYARWTPSNLAPRYTGHLDVPMTESLYDVQLSLTWLAHVDVRRRLAILHATRYLIRHSHRHVVWSIIASMCQVRQARSKRMINSYRTWRHAKACGMWSSAMRCTRSTSCIPVLFRVSQPSAIIPVPRDLSIYRTLALYECGASYHLICAA